MITPDLAGEIIGFRGWFVEHDSVLNPPTLLSMYVEQTRWPHNDWLHAECPYSDQEGVPHENVYSDHKCGIYAARNRSHLIDLAHYNDDEHRVVVIGEVGLAGKVIPGELGWRASKARPVRLYVPYLRWDLVKPLSEGYGVPVELSNILKKGARRGHRP